MSIRTLFLVALSALIATPIAAQRERQRAPRARVWVNGQEMSPLELVANRRARLGITVAMDRSDNDSIGATVGAVTPGGPASKAGIRSGDIIVRFDGQRLVGAARPDGAEDASPAGLQLIELVAQLEPGDTVALEYRRGDETRTANVITSSERILSMREFGGDHDFTLSLPRIADDLDGVSMPRFKVMKGDSPFTMSFGGPFADLELAPINPDLGAYFGTTEGVLVIDTPEKSSLGLKGGDVILKVDGREARGPSSLLRILRSYEPGDPIKLEIVRNKSRQTISSKIERNEEE